VYGHFPRRVTLGASSLALFIIVSGGSLVWTGAPAFRYPMPRLVLIFVGFVVLIVCVRDEQRTRELFSIPAYHLGSGTPTGTGVCLCFWI